METTPSPRKRYVVFTKTRGLWRRSEFDYGLNAKMFAQLIPHPEVEVYSFLDNRPIQSDLGTLDLIPVSDWGKELTSTD